MKFWNRVIVNFAEPGRFWSRISWVKWLNCVLVGHQKTKVMIDQHQIQILNRLGWKIFLILFNKLRESLFIIHQPRVILFLERKQFHPSNLSWKKPFLVVSVPNQVNPLSRKWRHRLGPRISTYAIILVRYADSSSSEDHSDYVLLDREENWKFLKNHKLFLFAFKQGFRYFRF